MDNGFHDFTDPKEAFEKLFEEMRQREGTDYDISWLMDQVALSLMHIGIDRDTYDITKMFRACMYALGQTRIGQSLGKVTLRVGKHQIGAAFAIDRDIFDGDIGDLTATEKEAMNTGIVCCLRGMGAQVEDSDHGITITGWDEEDGQQHPVHGVGATLDIDKTVSEFRHELDEVLGDSDDPMSRWMTRPKKEDK